MAVDKAGQISVACVEPPGTTGAMRSTVPFDLVIAK
jgi:hypothetical protein